MEDPEHRETVLAELKKALSRDRTRMTVNGFTQLGLVEMTRKRTRDSLAHQLCEPCPLCEARRTVRPARTVCYEILDRKSVAAGKSVAVRLDHGGRRFLHKKQ